MIVIQKSLLGDDTISNDEFTRGYGIPYTGNKQAIAEDLMHVMLKYKPNAKYFYDLFGGGGAMSFCAMRYGLKVFYNELNTQICELLKFLQNNKIPEEWYKFVTREEFHKHKNDMTAYGGFVSQVYSFGSNGKNYLYNPQTEKIKHLMHDVVVYKDSESLIKLNSLSNLNMIMPEGDTILIRRLDLYKQIREYGRLDLEQLQRLERLLQLERLERLEITNKSYDEVVINTPIDETIVYLDAPYKDTVKYKASKQFDYDKLYNWFTNNKYTCFMSEYSAPFKEIFSIEKIVTFCASDNRLKKVEKLYWNER